MLGTALLQSINKTIKAILLTQDPLLCLNLHLRLAELLMEMRSQAVLKNHPKLAKSLKRPIIECLNYYNQQFER